MSKLDTAWFNEDTNEVHLPKGRLLYPNLFTPRGIKDDPDSKPKFSATVVLPADADIEALKTVARDALKAKFGDKMPKKLRTPFLKTEDTEQLAAIAEDFPVLIRASANPDFPPFIFGPDTKPFRGDKSDVYGGRWAIITVRPYAYDTAGNKGVAFGLQRVQLLDHDEPIGGGRIETASGFEAVNVKGAKPKNASAAFDSDDADEGENTKAAPASAKRNAKQADLDDEIPF